MNKTEMGITNNANVQNKNSIDLENESRRYELINIITTLSIYNVFIDTLFETWLVIMVAST